MFSKNIFNNETIITDSCSNLETWLVQNPEYISRETLNSLRPDIIQFFLVSKENKKKTKQAKNILLLNRVQLHLRISSDSRLCASVFKKEILNTKL